jgi:hypothetical protein
MAEPLLSGFDADDPNSPFLEFLNRPRQISDTGYLEMFQRSFGRFGDDGRDSDGVILRENHSSNREGCTASQYGTQIPGIFDAIQNNNYRLRAQVAENLVKFHILLSRTDSNDSLMRSVISLLIQDGAGLKLQGQPDLASQVDSLLEMSI